MSITKSNIYMIIFYLTMNVLSLGGEYLILFYFRWEGEGGMKKILLALVCICSPVFADIPHVNPDTSCGAGQLCCPLSIVCDYLQGCGALPIGWSLAGSPSQFSGLKTFNISRIAASQYSPANDSYLIFDCGYSSDAGDLGLSPPGGSPYKLGSDNWTFSFMKQNATCNTPNNPSSCSFIPMAK